MNRKKRLFLISGIIIFTGILSYFLIIFYVDKQYANALPSVPEFADTETSQKDFFTKANVKVQDNPSVEHLGELGMIYHANNYFDEAEKCYELAIKREPKQWVWYYYLGCLKREMGDSEKAITNYNKVLTLNANAYTAWYYLGEAYQQIGANAKAENTFKKLLNIDEKWFVYKNTKRTSYFPLPLYAKLQIAKSYTNSSKEEDAEKELKNLLRHEITFGPAYRQLSILYAKKGNSNLSKYYSERSNDLNMYISPVDTLVDKLAYFSRSETYLLKQVEDAIRSSNSHWALELLTLGLKNVPDSKYLKSKAIKQFLDMKAGNKALPLLDNHINAFRNNYKELIEVGVGLSDSGYKVESEKYFSAAESIDGEKAKTKSTLAGMFYEKLGLKTKALSFIENLITKYPNNPDVLSDAIFLFLQTKDMKKVGMYLNRLKRVAPLNPDINIFNGILSQNNGDVNHAVKYYEAALKVNPEKTFIISYLKDYYYKNKMWSKLVNLYQIALKKDSNSSYLQEAYGTLLLDCPDKTLRNLEKAKEFSERAFINCRYTLETRVAAGRSLAIAHFELKNQGKGLYYISETIKMARKARAPKSYISNLESISKDFQNIMSSGK